MRDPDLLEIYFALISANLNSTDGAALLDRLAFRARDMAGQDESFDFQSGHTGDCLHAVADSGLLFSIALSRWLSRDADIPLGKALQHQASVARLDQTHPQSYDLQHVEEPDAIVAAKRLCALAAAPAVSLGWALSMARQFPDSASTASALTELLDYHIHELPRSTQTLLASSESVFGALDASINGLRRLQESEAELSILPHLRELEMTADMRLIFSTLKRNEHREIHRQAEERSIFALVTRRIHLKYSLRPTIEVRGEGSSTESQMAMVSHELTVELPLSEGADPMLGRAKRNRLWRGR
jgi:hypothetical protein